jgi:predicted metal-dependent hydrolase
MTKTLVARAPRLDPARAASPAWFGGNPTASHISNAIQLLFPAGERFFVRSVLHYEAILPPDLAAQVRGFCKQEGRHARAHERFFQNLRDQGHDVDGIVARYERLAYGILEKGLPPALRLAVTAALEHYTALLSEDGLAHDRLAFADPEMRRLLEWHAVEELEHKAVAFEVLQVAAPSYALRMVGLALATLVLTYFWRTSAWALLKSEGLSRAEVRRQMRDTARAPSADFRGIWEGLRRYMRRDFHPNEVDHEPLIAATLKRLEEQGAFATEKAA